MGWYFIAGLSLGLALGLVMYFLEKDKHSRTMEAYINLISVFEHFNIQDQKEGNEDANVTQR